MIIFLIYVLPVIMMLFSLWFLIVNQLTYRYKTKMSIWAYEDVDKWIDKSYWIRLKSQSYNELFKNKLFFKRFDNTISGEYKDEFISWLDRN